MSCSAIVIEDSVSKEGARLTTMQLRYWRAIHGEVMTHRVFSRNASSSRAIPVRTVLKQVWNEPAGPIHWGANQPGMQAHLEISGWRRKTAKLLWRLAGKVACVAAWSLMKLGLHKQAANRLLEPWQYISVILSSTEWENFFELRNHPDAQPEIKALAEQMLNALEASTPKVVDHGGWHLPYVSNEEKRWLTEEAQVRCSTARNARVSYLTHDGKEPSLKRDMKLYDQLVGSSPIHASPAEHVATPDTKSKDGRWANPHLHGNFVGWIQHRKEIEINTHRLARIAAVAN